MRIDVISLFPEWVRQLEQYGVVGRALRDGKLALHAWNPRDYSDDANRRIDDRPFGGGPGMVMQTRPLEQTLTAIRAARGAEETRVPLILLSPRGPRFDQAWAQSLAGRAQGCILLCGRYEGIDQRFIDRHVDTMLSIGDIVLSGGELPAMLVIDAVARLMPGVLGDADSAAEDSFARGLLDHPHYTRPAGTGDDAVPDVLLSGDHAAIARWREQQALGWTWLHRPDLLEGIALSAEQKALLQAFIANNRV